MLRLLGPKTILSHGFWAILSLGVLVRSRLTCKPKTYMAGYMGGCQSYGPFLGPYFYTAPII